MSKVKTDMCDRILKQLRLVDGLEDGCRVPTKGVHDAVYYSHLNLPVLELFKPLLDIFTRHDLMRRKYFLISGLS